MTVLKKLNTCALMCMLVEEVKCVFAEYCFIHA